MYIKGISKVLIVITILLSVFLVTPSKVEATVYDAPLSCPAQTVLLKGDLVLLDICCPTVASFQSLILASNPSVIKSVQITGVTYRESAGTEQEKSQCKVKYSYQDDKNVTYTDKTFVIQGTKPEYKCPVNTCLKERDFGEIGVNNRCLTQLTADPKDNNKVCCVTKSGQQGQIVSKNSCVPDMTVGVTIFNQALQPITAEEVCKKDAGFVYDVKVGKWVSGTSDTRPVTEKDLIFKNCNDCLKNPKNLWTGVGCMEASLNGIITTIIRIFYGIITALMLIKIIIAGYKYYGGDPEQLKDSKAEIFSAIGAAFALTLGIIALRYIGIDILGLGGIDGISSGLPILK